jgi:AcrR family transcriptional regulator
MRLAGTNGEATGKAIREVAVRVFARHGFQAASLRLIAKEIGIQAPSLYNYIDSKEQLLFELLRDPLVQMTNEYRDEIAGVSDAFERLRIFIRVHLNFHLDNRLDVFIGNMELRNLTKPHYREVTKLRDGYSELLTALIEDGVKQGVFVAEDSRVTTFAMLAMLSGVCNWFRPDGPLGKGRIMEIHTRLAFEMLGLDPRSANAVVTRPALPLRAKAPAAAKSAPVGKKSAVRAVKAAVKAD